MSKTSHLILLILGILLLTAGRLEAGSVTIAWDPNTESDVASYTVYWGTQSGVYTSSAPAGNVTSYTVTGLVAGQTYYFVVQAVSSDGLVSPLSAEVSTTIPLVGPTGETEAQWMARFGITDMSADDDGDGVSNLDEFLAGTDPAVPNTWYLAEGCTGFFHARIALANPGTDTAEITITFMRQGTTPIVQQYSIPGLSRKTITLNDIPGLENISVSAIITTQRGGVVVERTMTWNGTDSMDSGHTGKATPQASTSWYFAEGDARLFDTYLLLANPNSNDATVQVAFMLDSGVTVNDSYVVTANQRRTIYTNNVPGVGRTSFAMTIRASAPIMAERAMYFSTQTEWWKGGHDSAGVEAPSTQWFIAEGHTGQLFAEYLLLANPNAAPATATVRYLVPSGNAITQTYQVAAASRMTIMVNSVPGLADTDVSASITSTLPIVAERSMYWPGRWGQWYEGHNSVALAALGTKWALAEGETGGSHNMVSFVLLANPTDQAASVTLTVLRDNGLPPVVTQKTVNPNSRLTVNSTQLALNSGEQFGMIVESTNNVPIAVERSMYLGRLRTALGGGHERDGNATPLIGGATPALFDRGAGRGGLRHPASPGVRTGFRRRAAPLGRPGRGLAGSPPGA